ncbi:hypothetical protein ILUMI_02477 [Ignelater luminosus]|uniref:DUF7491 domain-containing protein n=1 Tax=Ignelater luminosus TaxID=2038154 RepID=A0A8K0DI63_IGNLU|nr:hypothetical protein ILUMI_02477 [Ignelater luminosus]
MNKNKSLSCRPAACQYPIGNNQKCGETQTLEIIKEFRQLYENKMKQIDAEGGGDCVSGLQAKLDLQHEWIRDLTEQNEMLVKTVEELESEATERVLMLEEKLRNSAKNGCEVMQKYRDFSLSINLDETFQKLVYLQSDLRNILEFIRRVREEDNWNTDGLEFYNVKCEDLLGDFCENDVNGHLNKYKISQKLKEKNEEIEELKRRSIDAANECDRCKIKIEELQQESDALKKAVFVTKRQFEDLEGKSNAYENERDEYRQKHRESVELAEKMGMHFASEKENYEKMKIEYEEALTALVQKCQEYERLAQSCGMSFEECRHRIETYESLQAELESVKKEHRNSLDQVIALNAENRSQNEKISHLQEALSQKECLEVVHVASNDTNTETSSICLKEEKEAEYQLRVTELENMLEKTQKEREIERGKRNQEALNLKQTISELEKALRNSQIRSESLQKAVDLYQNSVNVLEASEERSKIEISQQRQTILNLQEALITSKHQLNELQQKSSSEINNYIQYINHLQNLYTLLENRCHFYNDEANNLSGLVEYLRDINIDLEVENFGFVQDVAMLETRLLKYQQMYKSFEECTCGLKNEVLKLQSEKQQLDHMNERIKQELVQIACELRATQNIAGDSNEIQNMLKKANEELQHQLEVIQQELVRETKINHINAERIEELQQMLGQKTLEVNTCEDAIYNTQKKLDITLCCNKELKCELAQLLNQIKDYEQESAISEERSDYCQKEIESCRGNLTELRDKLLKMKDLLNQKIEQNKKLEADFRVQCNTIDCLKKQLEGSKVHYEDDLIDLKHTIQELNEKLTRTENNYQNLHEDYKKSQAQIIEITQREAKLQQENSRYEKEFVEKLQVLKMEEARLSECLNQLETESSILRSELMKKDHQMNLSQEEIITLKNEANKLYQANNKLQKENEMLTSQIAQLQNTTVISEEQFKEKSAQVDHCLCEIKRLQDEKTSLETKNKNFKKELHSLQHQYRDLDDKYQQLNDSVITLQMEVVDHKMCRDEICVESRNVITNVRAWLQDQALINEKLTQKLQDDEFLIDKLKQHNAYLQSKCACCLKGTCKRQRGGCQATQSQTTPSNASMKQNASKVLWNSSSQGSGSVSPNSTDSNNFDWYVYEEYNEEQFVEEDSSLLNHCLKKVESINEELQKSNKFWQSKMIGNDYVVTRDQ